jgi:hypothetical protein
LPSAVAWSACTRDHGEFVAAHAAHDVALAHIGEQPVGDRPDRRVPRRVAEAVVDALQVVQVEIDQAGRGPIALGEGADAAQLPDQRPPVQERRQGVAVG